MFIIIASLKHQNLKLSEKRVPAAVSIIMVAYPSCSSSFVFFRRKPEILFGRGAAEYNNVLGVILIFLHSDDELRQPRRQWCLIIEIGYQY